MPDAKISALTSKPTPDASDLLVIVDVADLSMAPSGTDKRTTVGGLVLAESQVTGLVADLAARQPLDADLTALAALSHAKGQVIADTGTAWAALAPGTSTQVLTLDSTTATGVKWATPAGATIGGAVPGGTAGRVLYEEAGPVLADSPNLTFSGSVFTVKGTATVDNTAAATYYTGLSLSGYGASLILQDTSQVAAPFRITTAFSQFFIVNVSTSESVAVCTEAGQWLFGNGNAEAGQRVLVVPTATNEGGLKVRGLALQTAPLFALQGMTTLPTARDLAYIDAGFVGGDRTNASFNGYVTISAGQGSGVIRECIRAASNGTSAQVGFLGATPVARAAAPTTLADVITILRNLGLSS